MCSETCAYNAVGNFHVVTWKSGDSLTILLDLISLLHWWWQVRVVDVWLHSKSFMRSVVWSKSNAYLISWKNDHLVVQFSEWNLSINSWFKHWIDVRWVSLTVSNKDRNLISIHEASLLGLRILVADIQSGNWDFILDFHISGISSSCSDVFNMIETGNSTWKSLSLTELEVYLELIINQAFHHLFSDCERS